MKSPETLAAVVLAAGAGSRMGGVAKPLIRIGGKTIVEHLVRSLQKAGIEHIVVVISPHTQRVQQTLTETLGQSASGLTFIEVCAGRDQMHSLHQGLRHLGHVCDGVMVCLADQPWLDAQAIAELHMAFIDRSPHTDMVVPCVNGQPGNPVVLSSPLVRAWLPLDERHIGKVWRDAYPQRVHHWITSLDAFITDLDTQEDLKALSDWGLELSL